jgi:two-component system sensor histidine kinase RegB
MTTLEPDWDDASGEAGIRPVFGRVRLRTLILLRWLAVAGQTIAWWLCIMAGL